MLARKLGTDDSRKREFSSTLLALFRTRYSSATTGSSLRREVSNLAPSSCYGLIPGIRPLNDFIWGFWLNRDLRFRLQDGCTLVELSLVKRHAVDPSRDTKDTRSVFVDLRRHLFR